MQAPCKAGVRGLNHDEPLLDLEVPQRRTLWPGMHCAEKCSMYTKLLFAIDRQNSERAAPPSMMILADSSHWVKLYLRKHCWQLMKATLAEIMQENFTGTYRLLISGEGSAIFRKVARRNSRSTRLKSCVWAFGDSASISGKAKCLSITGGWPSSHDSKFLTKKHLQSSWLSRSCGIMALEGTDLTVKGLIVWTH